MAICGFLWSLGGVFIKLISWNPFMIAGLRSAIAAAVLSSFMAKQHIHIKLCGYSIGAGIGLSASCICFTVANKLTTAANAVVLQYSAPIFVLLITALFFKQRLRRNEILAVAGAMAGIVLFFFDQLSPGSILGNIFGILAGITLALMLVMVGRGGEDDSIRMSGILLAHCITAVIGLSVGMPIGFDFSGIELVYIIILGVFQLGIPYVLYGIASKDCPPLACSLIAMIEPLFNPVWVAIFAAELPGTFAFIGGGIIIAIVTWWCIQEQRQGI